MKNFVTENRKEEKSPRAINDELSNTNLKSREFELKQRVVRVEKQETSINEGDKNSQTTSLLNRSEEKEKGAAGRLIEGIRGFRIRNLTKGNKRGLMSGEQL